MLKKTIFTLTLFLVAAVALVACNPPQEQAKEKIKISVLIPGKHLDGGFMEAGFKGYEMIKNDLGDKVDVDYVSDVSATSDQEVLTQAMRELAKKNPNAIIAHGGQCNKPAETIAKEFPNIKFIVIQGNVKGDNLSSYVVKQEESAWLAGALAGLTTKTNTVGHISGAWPNPGLIGRAAFYDGLKHTNPEAKFLTWFTGNLDDPEINRQAAISQINNGADIIYTMLNSGRSGVTEEIEKHQGTVWEIGNVSDWTTVSPAFIGSAVADSKYAIFNSAKSIVEGTWEGNQIHNIGLEENEVVRLAMSSEVPESVKSQIEALKTQLIKGEIVINTQYDGQEFNPATNTFVDQSFKETLKK